MSVQKCDTANKYIQYFTRLSALICVGSLLRWLNTPRKELKLMETYSAEEEINIVDIFTVDRQGKRPDDVMLICTDDYKHFYHYVVLSKTQLWYELFGAGSHYFKRFKAHIIRDEERYRNACIVTHIEPIKENE